MKSKNGYLVVSFVAALFLVLTVKTGQSNRAQPAAGNDGAPNTLPPHQTCAQCHSGSAQMNAVPNVDFTFNDGFTSVHIADFQYELGKTYLISYIPLTTSKRYGFQMSALTSTNANGGTFALTDPTHTTIISTPTTYVAHHNASSWNQWLFNWTAPLTDVGAITFYYVFNASDSSGDEHGDTIYVGSGTVHAMSTGIQPLNGLKNLSVYPNPVSDVLNVSFDMDHPENAELALFSMDGKLVENLDRVSNVSSFNSSLPISGLAAGIYLLQIKAGERLTTRKIVVE